MATTLRRYSARSSASSRRGKRFLPMFPRRFAPSCNNVWSRIGGVASVTLPQRSSSSTTTPAVVASSPARMAWLVAALSAAALIGTFVWLAAGRSQTEQPDLVRFTIAPPDNTSFGGPSLGGTGNIAQVAISPDGRNIAYV